MYSCNNRVQFLPFVRVVSDIGYNVLAGREGLTSLVLAFWRLIVVVMYSCIRDAQVPLCQLYRNMFVNLQKESNGIFDSLLLLINKSRRSILNKINFNSCNDPISWYDIKYHVMLSIRVCVLCLWEKKLCRWLVMFHKRVYMVQKYDHRLTKRKLIAWKWFTFT